jgi:putative polyhydroxyalkanoate system protein
MATIDIRRSHSLALETARSRAEALAEELAKKLGIRWKWQGDAIEFTGESGAVKGVKGRVGVSTADVHVAIDLPLLLRAMKGTIAAKVESKLDKLVS